MCWLVGGGWWMVDGGLWMEEEKARRLEARRLEGWIVFFGPKIKVDLIDLRVLLEG